MWPFTKKIRQTPENPPQEIDVLDVTRRIGPIIDKAAYEVFVQNRDELLARPITYIVPAVWGVKQSGELDEIQEAISARVGPVAETVVRELTADGMNESQIFAIGYLVKGIIISKITYMIEALKLRLAGNEAAADEEAAAMERIDPLGSA